MLGGGRGGLALGRRMWAPPHARATSWPLIVRETRPSSLAAARARPASCAIPGNGTAKDGRRCKTPAPQRVELPPVPLITCETGSCSLGVTQVELALAIPGNGTERSGLRSRFSAPNPAQVPPWSSSTITPLSSVVLLPPRPRPCLQYSEIRGNGAARTGRKEIGRAHV